MFRTVSSLCLALAASACSPLGDDHDAGSLMQASMAGKDAALPLEEALETAKEDCLLMVWSEQNARNVAFDREHDLVEGGAISCATGTSASQFDAAIIAIREAAKSGNKARMLDQIGMPLVYIDAEGERRPIEDRATVDAIFDEVFDARMLATLQKLDLSQMTVVPDQGAFFELGSLWLVVGEKGGRPSIVTVNRQALDDAAKAAHDKATRKDSTPLAGT